MITSGGGMATAEKPFDDVKSQPVEATEANSGEVLRIGLGAWLRSMAAIAASIFRHPLSTTYVDLSTGETVQIAE
jgi:hypothetical protein